MPDAGFPNTHTTTTVVQPSGSKSNIHLDLSYLHTTDGRIKCGQIFGTPSLRNDKIMNNLQLPIKYFPRQILNLLGFICILSSPWKYVSRGNWFNTVAMGGFWFSGIMLAFFIFHVPENFKVIPWLKVEFVFCALWTFFYLIAAALVADMGQHDEAMGAAAFFGFCAVLLYGYDAYLKFRQLKEERNTVQTINMPPSNNPPPSNPTY